MKKTIRKILIPVLAVILVGSVAMMVRQQIQYKQAEEIYSEAEDLVALPDLEDLPVVEVPQQPETPQREQDPEQPAEEEKPEEPKQVYVDPYADALRAMDFAALREVNEDVLGWILIPNTKISYPYVQGDDNSYYLKRTWRKTRSDVGAIFLEWQNQPDLSDFNTVIYGHRMNNRSMFGTLDYYKKADYMKAHPYIYITDDRGCHTYEVFAAYEVAVDDITYILSLEKDRHKQEYIDWCLDQSVVDSGVVPTVNDRIVTLSTCTGRGHATRWVVQGVLRGENLTEEEQTEAPDETVEEPVVIEGETGEATQTPAGVPAEGEGGLPSGETSVPEEEAVQPTETPVTETENAQTTPTEEGAEGETALPTESESGVA